MESGVDKEFDGITTAAQKATMRGFRKSCSDIVNLTVSFLTHKEFQTKKTGHSISYCNMGFANSIRWFTKRTLRAS